MTEPQPVRTQDSWVNPTTGVGGPEDKTTGFVFVPGTDRIWSGLLLSELYEVDDICARIVDALPSAAIERGWRLETDLDAQASEAVRDSMDGFGVQKHLMRSRKWSRLYGGAAIYMGSDDGPQDAPLRYGGRLHFLQSYERDELQPHRYYDDPLSAKFGDPSHYRLTPIRNVATAPSVIIHESRLVVMHGADTTHYKRAQNNGWGSSILIRPMKAVQQFHSGYAIVLSLLADANQNIYKWKGLADVLLRGEEKAIKARMRVIDEVRSTVHAIAVDAEEEDFVRSQLNLTGIDGILDRFATRMASAVPMPVTVLMGQSPAGMNATGESDLRNWNAQKETEQREVLGPALERMVRVLLRARNGPTGGVEPSTWSIKFNSLWAPTPREEAEIRSINAQTDQAYVDMEVLKPVHIAKARFSGDTEQNTPLIPAEELAAMGSVLRPLAPPPDEGEPGELEEPGAPPDAEDEPEVDTEDTDAVDDAIAYLVAKMNEHKVRACEHGIKNVCPRCGIERVRDFVVGPDGIPEWIVLWRPIGTRGHPVLSQAEQPAPPADA